MSWMCSLNGEIRNAYIDTILVGKTLRKGQLRLQWLTLRRIQYTDYDGRGVGNWLIMFCDVFWH